MPPEKPLTDSEAMRTLRLAADAADDVAGAAPHAWVSTPEGRRWDAARLQRWARVVGAVASSFTPTLPAGSGARGVR
jgi:hypothetical protein